MLRSENTTKPGQDDDPIFPTDEPQVRRNLVLLDRTGKTGAKPVLSESFLL
jgi:hypothetical protein